MRIHLSKAAKSEFAHQKLTSNLIISGKSVAPYIIPHMLKVMCKNPDKSCNTNCKYRECQTVNVLENISNVLRLINTREDGQQKALFRILDISKSCPLDITISQTTNVESLVIIPDGGEYVVRQAYYIGYGAECNKSYEAELQTIPDPTTNLCVHIISSLKEISSSIHNFKPSASVMQDLISIFCPKTLSEELIWEKLYEKARELSENVTRIYNRDLLTIGVDLVFHSVLHFMLGNEYIHKGWGEILLLGDTQCGKGATCERLLKYYGIGEVVSGENATFVGLVGGIQSINNESMLTWGRIVLNNEKLVVIDEISSLAMDGILRKMSRIRSEGISEIDKAGIHARADAKTRLIWIANPKSGNPMRDYTYGVNALRELIETNEDIARFDYVLTAVQNEVSSDIINKRHECTISHLPQEEEKILLNWIWSRKLNQIIFDPKAVLRVYELARQIPKLYSANIPLVQAENYRIKLSKVAIMIAARLCITDPPYTDLYIPVEVVNVAADFLQKTYKLDGLRYDLYSQSRRPKFSEESTQVIQKLSPEIRSFLESNKFLAEDKYPSDLILGLIHYGIIERRGNQLISVLYGE